MNNKYKRLSHGDKKLCLRHVKLLLKRLDITHINEKPISMSKIVDIWPVFIEKYKIDPVDSFLNRRKEIKEEKQKVNNKKLENKEYNSFVYFMVNERHGFCKIGYSLNPEKRLKELQTGCPVPIFIKKTIVGDLKLESKFHKYFRKYKSNGEWFYMQGELKEFVYNDETTFIFRR